MSLDHLQDLVVWWQTKTLNSPPLISESGLPSITPYCCPKFPWIVPEQEHGRHRLLVVIDVLIYFPFLALYEAVIGSAGYNFQF